MFHNTSARRGHRTRSGTLGASTAGQRFFRYGALNQNDIRQIVEYWEKQGLKPTGRSKGKLCWKDLCVVDIHGPTLPCD